MNNLQDCLAECTRIETARANCITAMNSCGITTPVDASLGMLPHYFGCDRYIGPSLSPKNPASYDDASTAISQLMTKKNNLKTLINVFCAPKGISITNEEIDDYYSFISNVGSNALRVEYISNPSSSDYIDLGITLDNTYNLSAELKWNNIQFEYDVPPAICQLFGSRKELYGANEGVFGFTAWRKNTAGVDSSRVGYYFPSGDYISRIVINTNNVTFTNCYTNITIESTTIRREVRGTINSISEIEINRSAQDIPVIDTHCLIFNNTGRCPANSRFYSAQIKNSGGTVIHNYLPYIVWGGCSWVPCVKDTITNVYYYNSGPNTLGYGPIVTT